MPAIAGRRIRLGLALKLVIVADMALNIMLAYFMGYAWPRVERDLTREREIRTEQQAEVAWNILQYNYRSETSGLATWSEAQVVGRQVEQISAAAEELNDLSGNMVSVIQQINRTIEENAAATEAMSESSSLVSGAIENVGGVAEENSASAEEVSASVEEMSAGVEEVLTSAQSLAEMSEGLEKSVAAFKTDDN